MWYRYFVQFCMFSDHAPVVGYCGILTAIVVLYIHYIIYACINHSIIIYSLAGLCHLIARRINSCTRCIAHMYIFCLDTI